MVCFILYGLACAMIAIEEFLSDELIILAKVAPVCM